MLVRTHRWKIGPKCKVVYLLLQAMELRDFRSAVQKAWQCILAKEADATSEKALVELFSEMDYLESQQFTKLHKIVLKLVPTDLEQELQVSTSTIDSTDSTQRTALAWASARYVNLLCPIQDHYGTTLGGVPQG